MATRKRKSSKANSEAAAEETVVMATVADLEITAEDKKAKKAEEKARRKELKSKNRGAMAPLALVLSLVTLFAIFFSLFYRPVSTQLVTPEASSALRVLLSISANEFITEGSDSGNLTICRGTKSFPNISKAVVFITDTSNKPIAEIAAGDATSKKSSTCFFELSTEDYKKFTGSKLKVFVRFTFGDSNIFNVDVGNTIPYNKINLRLSLS